MLLSKFNMKSMNITNVDGHMSGLMDDKTGKLKHKIINNSLNNI